MIVTFNVRIFQRLSSIKNLVKVLLVASKSDFEEDVSRVTGIGRYAREIYRGLKSSGIDVYTYPIYDYSSFTSSVLSSVKAILHNYADYDIVHLLSPKPFFPLRKGRAKWVTTVHDLFFLKYKESRPSPLMEKLYLRSILGSDSIIAVSSLVKEDVERLGYKGRVYVVNPGIGEEFFTTPRKERKERNVIKIGYIGRLDSERKDVVRGIRAFKKLKEENVVFELWGSYNPSSAIFKEIIKEAKDDPRIRIMGPAPDEKIIEIYDSFDAFFFPTKEEGFGLPIVEAQARGVPVIVFKDARVPPEVCEMCITANDELPDPEYIASFRENNYLKLIEFSSKFTIENQIKKLMIVYSYIIS